MTRARQGRSAPTATRAQARRRGDLAPPTGPVRVFVGGTFDGLHRGHLFLLEFARKRGAALARRQGRPGVHLSVVIARDESVRRIKHRPPHHNERERRALMAGLRLVDEAFVGARNDFIASVRRVNPELIVLGHDQKAGWEDALHAAGIYAKIVRCPPYERQRLKTTFLRPDLERMST